MHPDAVNKTNALEDGVLEVPQPGVLQVDVGEKFTIIYKLKLMLSEHMLQWIRTRATTLAFFCGYLSGE